MSCRLNRGGAKRGTRTLIIFQPPFILNVRKSKPKVDAVLMCISKLEVVMYQSRDNQSRDNYLGMSTSSSSQYKLSRDLNKSDGTSRAPYTPVVVAF